MALASLATGVGLLMTAKHASEPLYLPGASLAAAVCMLASGLIFWGLVPSSDDGGGAYGML